MPSLSVILPAYNEEAMLPKTAKVLAQVLETNERVHGVHFSRNFGKEAAIFAGLAAAKGDCAAVMDCDLQHPPQTLVQMYRLWQQGYEVIEGVKKSRGKESGAHRAAAGLTCRSRMPSSGR